MLRVHLYYIYNYCLLESTYCSDTQVDKICVGAQKPLN